MKVLCLIFLIAMCGFVTTPWFTGGWMGVAVVWLMSALAFVAITNAVVAEGKKG